MFHRDVVMIVHAEHFVYPVGSLLSRLVLTPWQAPQKAKRWAGSPSSF